MLFQEVNNVAEQSQCSTSSSSSTPRKEQAVFNFDYILQEIGENFVIVSEELGIGEEEHFRGKVRTSLPQGENYSSRCDAWVSKFSTATNTNWIVAKTFPNAEKRYTYRKVYFCHHSDFNKSKEHHRNNTVRYKGRGCKATINIIVKKNTANTRSKDKILKEGLDTQIEVNFIHNHRVKVATAYSYLKVSDSTREAFFSYFSKGMTPAEARKHHGSVLETSWKENEKLELLGNAAVNPRLRQIHHLFKQWRSRKEETIALELAASSPDEPHPLGIEVIMDNDLMADEVITENEAVTRKLEQQLHKVASLAKNSSRGAIQILLQMLEKIETPEQLEEFAYSCGGLGHHFLLSAFAGANQIQDSRLTNSELGEGSSRKRRKPDLPLNPGFNQPQWNISQ